MSGIRAGGLGCRWSKALRAKRRVCSFVARLEAPNPHRAPALLQYGANPDFARTSQVTDTSSDSRRGARPLRRGAARERDPRVLMLGMGWFPATLGGLNRYYRALFEQLQDARGVVIGPAEDAPPAVVGDRRAAGAAATAAARLLAGGRARARRRRAARRPLRAVRRRARCCSGAPAGSPRCSTSRARGRTRTSSRATARACATACGRAWRGGCTPASTPTWSCPRPSGGCSWSATACAPGNVHVLAPGVSRSSCSPPATASGRGRSSASPRGRSWRCARAGWSRAWGSTCCSTPGASSRASLPEGSTLLLVGDGPLREQLSERAGRPPLAGRVRVLGRVSDAELDRRLPRGRRGGRAHGRAGGLRAGGAGGRRLRHPERRQRRRRAGRGRAGARPLAGGRAGRRGGAGAAPAAGRRRAASRPRAHARASPRTTPGRRWPSATARCTARCSRAGPTRGPGRVPRPRRPAVRRGDPAEPPAAAPAGRQRARDPGRGRAAGRPAREGGRVGRGDADRRLGA